MAFWNKKKQQNERVQVICKCGAKYEVDCDGLGTEEIGYKGRLCFYTRCNLCGERIGIEEVKLPKKYIRRAYKNHIWC